MRKKANHAMALTWDIKVHTLVEMTTLVGDANTSQQFLLLPHQHETFTLV